MVAQSWLVFRLTNSTFLMGVVGFLSFMPIFLLTLFGGAVADRVNKRSILLFTQNAFMALAFLLAVLTQLKLVAVWHIIVIALLNGAVMAFDAPSRQAVVIELVGRKHLLNAVALNSAAFNAACTIGPALAGILIAVIGMSGCFYINAVTFLPLIFALLVIKTQHPQRQARAKSLGADVLEGLLFVKRNRGVLILISMVGVTSLFGICYILLMPVFANDIFNAGARGLGILMSASGLGAVVAALSLARLGDIRHKGRVLIFSALIFSVFLMLFAFSRVFLFSLLVLFFIGWASVTAVSLINTLLQTIVPDEIRGRMMSVFMFIFAGIMPFGNLLAGSAAALLGVSLTVFLGGLLCFGFFSVINLVYNDVRNL